MNEYLIEVIDRLKRLGRYDTLVKKLRASNLLDMSIVFEALFANCLELSGINLNYEVNVNTNNNSDVDFYYQIGKYSKFCFELLRPEMKDELKEESQKIYDDGFYGVELSSDHKKEYLRPEAQTIYLQVKLLEKVYKFPAPQENYYSILVVDCSNIHFGHLDDEDCRMVMYGKTASPVWQEKWLHKGSKARILGLLEQENPNKSVIDFRKKITSVIFIPEISSTPLKNAYIVLNIHRADSYKKKFRDTLVDMPAFQTLQWIEAF